MVDHHKHSLTHIANSVYSINKTGMQGLNHYTHNPDDAIISSLVWYQSYFDSAVCFHNLWQGYIFLCSFFGHYSV